MDAGRAGAAGPRAEGHRGLGRGLLLRRELLLRPPARDEGVDHLLPRLHPLVKASLLERIFFLRRLVGYGLRRLFLPREQI